ncbi:DUF86 domain-containing protein [Halobacillus shinanisalinarum]|uniref:DUF86 domain-containing protein n=1 Tax=Halobacillus shinanisalinarum TaxID=2932258 RepID=A0ABY4H1D2_9BACI|nr:DUF86 domain-containing protein [Halobacillus shinanisalinarum]UOQ94241.1 DUF86 domain-containing protein [Halobacillus shinanisalinarum]
MYFVDRKKIEDLLSYMETLILEQKEHTNRTFTDYLVLERMTHLTVEIIIDVGNQMIDGFIMRDPGSYEDIIDILTDEKVLPKEEIEAYKAIVRLRKMVVQQYLSVDHEAIITIWNTHSKSFNQFPDRIRWYLDEELGPVTAFSKE